jgi:serine/threonine protein kinase
MKLTRHISAYKMERKVGEGAYGAVFFARDLQKDKVVALKRVAWPGDPSNSEGLPVTTLREIMLLFAVRHENVVHLEEVLHGAALPLPFSAAVERV